MTIKLPTLKGTQKQIAWAETIRAEKLAAWEKMSAFMATKDQAAIPVAAAVQALTEYATRYFVAIDDAADWIDYRTLWNVESDIKTATKHIQAEMMGIEITPRESITYGRPGL